MIFTHIAILALVQGVTEFLPISSSGHLVLTHFAMNDGSVMVVAQQKTMDVAVHVGTLIAVIAYFWRDVFTLARGGVDILCARKTNESRLTFNIVIASIPVIIAGLILFQFDFSFFDSLYVVAWSTLIFGIVLYVADKSVELAEPVERFSIRESMIYGLFQCLALIPGVSRSGITMTAGRFMGHSRVEAARFSLLLGMVAISGAGTLTGMSILSDVGDIDNGFITVLAIGAGLSCVSAYGAIWLMMRWVSKSTFTPFVIYRVVLGVILLGLLYGGVIPQNI